ncbi:hypothetical protein DFQ28_009117 [Apophysomyces sp. BC1034]|nr:hypothetical protein DFQ30_009947 [Apophysomyces sp. BC1015]KAG0171512.1 hypothetical protein DFQ29_008796 [Apophysomyces sp. BC1021]KAG0185582.1 hypothetical protein DFQ28_009117 [Apophysomyces sp. BC1034]
MTERDSTICLKATHYLSIEGPYIDRIGSEGTLNISTECAANRLERDGKQHHVTLVSPPEMSKILKQAGGRKARKQYMQQLVQDIHERFGNSEDWQRPIDLGQGRCVVESSVTYFRVLHWPFGQYVRLFFGLQPSHFHITLGFDPKDIHQYKGPGALDVLSGHASCTRLDLDRLSALAWLYKEDYAFISALFKQAIRLCHLSVAVRAGFLCLRGSGRQDKVG